MRKAVGILFILLGISFFVVMALNFPADAADNYDKTFVSSFVVDGVDKGAGYFYFYNYGTSKKSEYRFTNQSGEKTIYYEVDNYTIDNSKQEEANRDTSNFTLWLIGIILLPMICIIVGMLFCFIE